uniref:RNA exonuclease 1 homolog-like domain-containing protein n=1 Tax=Cyprinus carpio carpio TaxID=630221 RepID=A0A8C1CT55_CYPCA
MFPSTALFDETDCPLFRWGRCNRPCLYNHGKDDTSGVMTTADLGDPEATSANGASHTTEDNYACLKELERINKEIKAAKSEVEKEQKDCLDIRHRKKKKKKKKPVSTTSGLKYVVDCARPKTDLEYDPCSNFSADFLSSSSVDSKLRSTDKVDTEHNLKNNRTGKKFQLLSSHFDDSDNEACVGIIPVGAVVQLWANLHLNVPEGNFALPVTLIPTTMSIQRPPQPAPSVQLSQTLHPPQPANHTPAKIGAKVPHDVRQHYVNLFVEEFLKSFVTVQDAFEKVCSGRRKNVYDRSINKLKYQSIAVNALKRLKSQNILPAKAPSERDQHESRGDVPLNTQALQGPGKSWLSFQGQTREHVLSEDMLRVNNFSFKHKDKADFAFQYGDTKKGISDREYRSVTTILEKS